MMYEKSGVKISQCRVNKGYGRDPKPRQVNKIIEKFDNRLLGVIVLCDVRPENPVDENGVSYNYEILDGQNRTLALTDINGEDYEYDIKNIQIVNYCPFEERAHLYTQYNDERTPLGSIDKFKSGLAAKYTENIAIYNICRKLGVNIKGIDSEAYPFLNAVTDIRELYRANTLEDALGIILDAYKNSSSDFRKRNFNREMLRSLKHFLLAYRNEIDKDILIKRLGQTRPIELIPSIKAASELDGVNGASMLVKLYNTRLSKNALDIGIVQSYRKTKVQPVDIMG